MASERRFSAISLSSCFFFFFSAVTGVSAAGIISGRIFEPYHTIGRELLQVEKNCPVDFEFQNYTIITSQCKGPRYLPDPCCNALKQFACPYADQLNDLTNNCATTMFNYINLAGNCPPGLFANECRDDKRGLTCNGTYTRNDQTSPASGTVRIVYSSSLLPVLTGGILCFLLM